MRRVALLAATSAVVLLVPMTQAGARAPKAETLPRYGVFEHTFHWPSAAYSNPWEQVTVEMTLTSPARRHVRIGGFYAAPDTWKARFSPGRLGRWRWSATVRDSTRSHTERGSFQVVRGSRRGFVRRNPHNRFRWVFSDGSPYYPLGIGDCVRDLDRSGSPFDEFGLDGRPKNDLDTYLDAYQSAGLNIFRWSVDNCAFGLYRTISPGGNVYREREGDWGDRFVRELRSHGFRVYMSIFGFSPPFAGGPTPDERDALQRYVKYVVDRYGAYVDFWELMNEAKASTAWYTQVAGYLRSVDPYRHPIATSWERPDLPAIDFNSPHWYEKESEFASDSRTWDAFNSWKTQGKPVIVGEQGNSGQNWDERSALRMRLRMWTAFFAEGALIFWNTSGTKRYQAGAANMYLGPEERQFFRVLQSFTRGFDASARVAPVTVTPSAAIRGYALSGRRDYAAYLHAFANHDSPTRGGRITIVAGARASGSWIDPATGRALARVTLRRGTQTLAVPPFLIDVALKLRFRRS
jgi:hypothetical protein